MKTGLSLYIPQNYIHFSTMQPACLVFLFRNRSASVCIMQNLPSCKFRNTEPVRTELRQTFYRTNILYKFVDQFDPSSRFKSTAT